MVTMSIIFKRYYVREGICSLYKLNEQFSGRPIPEKIYEYENISIDSQLSFILRKNYKEVSKL